MRIRKNCWICRAPWNSCAYAKSVADVFDTAMSCFETYDFRPYIEHRVRLILRPHNDHYLPYRCSSLIEHHLSSDRHWHARRRRLAARLSRIDAVGRSAGARPALSDNVRSARCRRNDSRVRCLWSPGWLLGSSRVGETIRADRSRQISHVWWPADHQINPVRMLQVVGEMRACSQPVSATAALNALWNSDGWTVAMAKSADRMWTTGNFIYVPPRRTLTNVILPVHQQYPTRKIVTENRFHR